MKSQRSELQPPALALAPNPIELEPYFRMTDRLQDPQQYWYIPVPKNKFAKPKFYPGQQVGYSWEDEFGNAYYDIGEIVGMQ